MCQHRCAPGVQVLASQGSSELSPGASDRPDSSAAGASPSAPKVCKGLVASAVSDIFICGRLWCCTCMLRWKHLPLRQSSSDGCNVVRKPAHCCPCPVQAEQQSGDAFHSVVQAAQKRASEPGAPAAADADRNPGGAAPKQPPGSAAAGDSAVRRPALGSSPVRNKSGGGGGALLGRRSPVAASANGRAGSAAAARAAEADSMPAEPQEVELQVVVAVTSESYKETCESSPWTWQTVELHQAHWGTRRTALVWCVGRCCPGALMRPPARSNASQVALGTSATPCCRRQTRPVRTGVQRQMPHSRHTAWPPHAGAPTRCPTRTLMQVTQLIIAPLCKACQMPVLEELPVLLPCCWFWVAECS